MTTRPVEMAEEMDKLAGEGIMDHQIAHDCSLERCAGYVYVDLVKIVIRIEVYFLIVSRKLTSILKQFFTASL